MQLPREADGGVLFTSCVLLQAGSPPATCGALLAGERDVGVFEFEGEASRLPKCLDRRASVRRSRPHRLGGLRDGSRRREAFVAAQGLALGEGLAACSRAFFGSADWPERVWGGLVALLGRVAANHDLAHLALVEPGAVMAGAPQRTIDTLRAFQIFLEHGYGQRTWRGGCRGCALMRRRARASSCCATTP